MSDIQSINDKQEFIEYCRDWLNDNRADKPDFRVPPGFLHITSSEEIEYFKNWQRRMYEAGLLGCDYPIEYGGQGKKGFQSIANKEMRRAGTLYCITYHAMGLVAPTLLFHGSEELKTERIPRIFNADDIWCQGFSEPGSGSDLASLRTSAVRDGDNWVVNGEKIWTSMGKIADWMFMIARTDKTDKYNGLTYFVLPVKDNLDKGLSVRPLNKITGEGGFSQVSFNNLVVPDACRVGEVGEGWKVAGTTLLHERHAGPMVHPGYGSLGETSAFSNAATLIPLLKSSKRYGAAASQDPAIRDRFAKLYIRHSASNGLRRRAMNKTLTNNPSRLMLQSKLLMSENWQETNALALEALGNDSSFWLGDASAPHEGEALMSYFDTFSYTIAGGTSEIQRNILGEKVLGLPKTR